MSFSLRSRKISTISLRKLSLVIFGIFCVQLILNFIVVDVESPEVLESVRNSYETDPKALDFLVRLPRNVLIVEPFHGLGNRLRAYACAAALAKKSNRHLVIIWIRDVHVNASMSALFETGNLTVIDFPVSHLLSIVWDDAKVYDYNVWGRKDEVMQDTMPLPIYVRSAYVLQSQTHVEETEISKELNSLMPSEQVQRRVNQMKSLLVEKKNLVGMHIRMMTDIRKDVPGIENYSQENPASAAHMGPVEQERSRCHYEAFMPHMEQCIRENPKVSFFVASDSSLAVSALRARYPERIISGGLEGCEGELRRRTNCLQSCLAEFLVFSRETSFMILSEWSSASELLIRLSQDTVPHKTGCLKKSSSLRARLGRLWA